MIRVRATSHVNADVIARVQARLRAEGERARQHDVKVGITADEGDKTIIQYTGEEGKKSLSYVALAHEYGAGVPERSWFRSWFDANATKMTREMREAMQAERDGERDAVAQLAQMWSADLRSWIQNGEAQLEPLASATLKEREANGIAGDTPLDAIGQIVAAIKATIDGEVLS